MYIILYLGMCFDLRKVKDHSQHVLSLVKLEFRTVPAKVVEAGAVKADEIFFDLAPISIDWLINICVCNYTTK